MDIHIEGYSFLALLHEGKRALIYRAQRNQDGMSVVLKIIKQKHPPPWLASKIRNEFEMLQKIRSAHVIKAIEVVSVEGWLMLILEDFEGIPLSKLFQDKPLDISRFLTIGIALADGLGDIHQEHIIHKDIKPSNIVVNEEKGLVKIIDFGIATMLSREVPYIFSQDLLEGTLAYISPEQTGRMNRTIDYRSDIYSMGVTLYEMITGKLPFASSDPMQLIHHHIAKAPQPPSDVQADIPETISTIIMKCLEKIAEDRYHSSYGLKNDLEECQKQLKESGVVNFFLPGEHDLYEQFQIPQKLYGREDEIKLLLETFERASSGPIEMLLVMRSKNT